MKKFFSAILLMTMMVFSVGTFVSCNDLVEEVETIKGQTSDIEAQISALETQIAALETALKGEIKSAADLAKAEAIAAAKAECETLKALLEAGAKDLEDYIALTNAKIEAIDADLAKMATKVELDEAVKELVAKDTELSMQITALEAYKATADSNFVEIEAALAEAKAIQEQLKTYAEENFNTLYDYIGKNAGLIETAFEDIEGLKAAVEEYYTELHNLIGTNASAIGATGEDLEKLTATVEEYYAELYDLIGQNTGFINTAFEEIDVLKVDVKKIQEALAALEPRVKALEEKIDKVDADLNLINAAIKDFVNQIQSIVLLPGDVTVNGYTYGPATAPTTVLHFLATYEVSPARLAGELANANLYFTNVVKGEPATYAAEFVSAKDGRVTVRGKITDKNTPAFQKFCPTVGSTVNPASQVHVALHVDQAKPGMAGETEIDGGTYVSSSFAELKPGVVKSLGELVYLYNTAEQKVIADANGDRILTKAFDYDIPFTTPVANSTRTLFPIDFRVKIEDNYLTLAETAEFFGLSSFEPAIKVGKAKYVPASATVNGQTEDTKNFLKVTNDETVDVSIALGRAATKEDKDRGTYAEVKITEITVAGLPTGLTASSKYSIVAGKATDIEIETYKADWSYKFYDYHREHVFSNRVYGTAELDIDSDIKLTDSELITTKAYDESTETFIPAQLYDETPGTYVTFLAKAYKADNTPYMVKPSGATQPSQLTGTVNLSIISAKVARLENAWLPFADEPLKYKVEFDVTDPSIDIFYDASFVIELGARPEDKDIEINGGNAVELLGSLKHERTYEFNAIDAILTTDAAFYGDLKSMEFENYYDDYKEFLSTSKFTEVENASTNDGTNFVTVSELYYDEEDDEYVEQAVVTVPEELLKKYEDTYKVKHTYKFYGVEYTFVGEIKTTKPTIKLEANSMRVPASGVVEMHGTYKEPEYNKKDKKFDYAAYALNTINLRELVKINNGGADFESDEYQILYTLKTEYMDGTTKVSGSSIAEIDYSTGSTTDVDAEAIVTWNDKNVNELTYDIQLVSATDTDIKFGDPVTIKLVVPELVTVTGSKKEVVYNNAEKYSVGNFVQGLSIVNKLSGNAIFKEGATFWNNSEVGGYLDATDSRATNDDSKSEYNLYNFKYAIDATKITGKLADGTKVDLGEDFKYYAADETLADGSKRHAGDIEIDMNNSGIDQNVEIKIPVTITHDYQGVGDNACEHTVTVTLLFLAEEK